MAACQESSPPSLTVDWRTARFGDWGCCLGGRSYTLHKVMLTSTNSRGCHFFDGAFNEEFGTTGTDLDTLLPAECHSHFDAALDFIYGHDVSFTPESAVRLYRIADVLLNDTLRQQSHAALRAYAAQGSLCLELALEARLPPDILELFVDASPLAKVLTSLGNSETPDVRDVLRLCARKAERAREMLRLSCTAGPENLAVHAHAVKFASIGSRKLRLIIGDTDVCRVRVVMAPGYAAIGIAKSGAAFGFSELAEGAFGAYDDPWWGLCLGSGSLYAKGCVVSSTGRTGEDFADRVVQIRLNRARGCLTFLVERQGSCEPVGVIEDDFTPHEPLMFTVSAWCGPTTYHVLAPSLDDLI